MVPSDYKAEGVVAAFGRMEMKGKRVLFPRADKARDLIQNSLGEMGADVEAPVTYCNLIPDTIPERALQALEEQRIQCVTFTSSSTAENLAAILGENRMLRLLEGVTVAAIGPITAKTCRELGLDVHIESKEYTLEKMTKAITDFFNCQ
jgi:uroporphyrinogen III methyltransferase/synthase